MKNVAVTGYSIFSNVINVAYKGLKTLCDPSVEGDPYITELPPSQKIKYGKPQKIGGGFGRRRFAYRNY